MSKLQLVQSAYDERMKREARWLSVLAVQSKTEQPLENIARVLSVKLTQEWKRATTRHADVVGLDTSHFYTSERLQKCLTATLKLLRDSDVASPKFATRLKSITVTAMTAVRSAGAFDVMDLHRNNQVVKNDLITAVGKPGARFAKEWFTMRDELVCDHCDELDGVVVNAYSGVFEATGLDKTVDGPPLHPNCRCEILVSKRYTRKRKSHKGK